MSFFRRRRAVAWIVLTAVVAAGAVLANDAGLSPGTLGSFALRGKHRPPFTVSYPVSASDQIHLLPFSSNPVLGFEGINAAHVQVNVTARHQLGQKISLALLPPGPQEAQRMAMTLGSLSLGRNTILVPITWLDGSRSTYVITSSGFHEAKYLMGSGRDADGNRFLDASLFKPEKLDDFVRTYKFSSETRLQEWLKAASLFGVTVAGTPSAEITLQCVRAEARLACHYR